MRARGWFPGVVVGAFGRLMAQLCYFAQWALASLPLQVSRRLTSLKLKDENLHTLYFNKNIWWLLYLALFKYDNWQRINLAISNTGIYTVFHEYLAGIIFSEFAILEISRVFNLAIPKKMTY